MLFRFLAALQFLTRLPVKLRRAPTDEELAKMMVFFPLVGLLIGAAGAGLGAGLIRITHAPPLVGGVIVTGFWVAVTGALHLDGLADTYDALLSGRRGPEAGAVMKDSRVGAMGAVSLVLVLVAKVVAVGAVLEAGQWWPLILAPAIGRWWAVISAWLGRSPDWCESGIGKILAGRVSARMVGVSGAFVVVASMVAVGVLRYEWVVPIAAGCIAGLWLTYQCVRVIGGVTGDALGAGIEVAETAALLAAVLVTAGG